jgi:RNA polymerase sigma factor (TIGR02999 family)
MRRILIDHARAQQADKRGGGWERTTLAGDVAASTGTRQFDVLALHEALERLAEFDPRQARIVELRYFGGLTVDETAEVMNLSTATVEREWTIAKAWLRVNLAPQAG